MIAILDYDAGNLHSVLRGCEHVGARARILSDRNGLARADRLIIPGVGRAGSAVRAFQTRGFDGLLHDALRAGTPILGICVGAQIILERSTEDQVRCLGLIPGESRSFQPLSPDLKVPHMGWNQVDIIRSHPLLEHLRQGDQMYFAHSYYPAPTRQTDVYAEAVHGVRFGCAVGRDNLFATQFHPEKSGRSGLEVLWRFSSWDGCVRRVQTTGTVAAC